MFPFAVVAEGASAAPGMLLLQKPEDDPTMVERMFTISRWSPEEGSESMGLARKMGLTYRVQYGEPKEDG